MAYSVSKVGCQKYVHVYQKNHTTSTLILSILSLVSWPPTHTFICLCAVNMNFFISNLINIYMYIHLTNDTNLNFFVIQINLCNDLMRWSKREGTVLNYLNPQFRFTKNRPPPANKIINYRSDPTISEKKILDPRMDLLSRDYRNICCRWKASVC